MFHRGEEILSANTNKNTPNTTCSNSNNQIIEDKNLILSDFTTNIQQNLITNSSSQESQKNISNSCNQFNNSPKSSASSTNNYSIPNQEQTQSIKRKSTAPHHPSTYNPKNAYYQKPVYSEILSSKCILYIYYKGDLTNIVDDHFKKSMNVNATKSSATLSPLSLSSPSPSIKNAKNSKNSSPTCSKSEFSESKDAQTWSKNHCQSYDSWLYYNNGASQIPNSSIQYPSHHHDHYWNRTQVDMSSFYSNQPCSNYYKFNSAAQFSNCQYMPDTSDPNLTYLSGENFNRQSLKNCLKSSKEEPRINGSFIQAAVAAVINPSSFPTQSGGQNDFCQYNISAPVLSSSSSSLSSLSSTPLTHNLSINPNPETIAAAAAVAANQYLNATASSVSSSLSPNSYCHGKYHQYLDLSKSTPQVDCRRSSTSNYTTYAYEFDNSPVNTNIISNGAGSSFKNASNTNTNTQNFSSPIWY